MLARREMLDLLVVDGRARGVIARDLVSGALEAHVADAVVLATGGYANVYFLSTNAKASNATAIWRAYRRGAAFANPGFVQFHPTCLPAAGTHQAKLTLMSESLRNDGRVWVPLRAGDDRRPEDIPESERDYFLERRYPRYGNLVPRDVASRAVKAVCDDGRGIGPGGRGVYLDLTDAAQRLGADVLRERYGNVFEMYQHLTGDDPLRVAMRIAPAAHYTMGGLWVDYDLMSTIPGLFVDRRGQLLRSGRQPARRQRAHAGARRRVLHPAGHAGRLSRRRATRRRSVRTAREAAAAGRGAGAPREAARAHGRRTASDFHRALGQRAVGRLRARAESRTGWPRRSTRSRRCARRSGGRDAYPEGSRELNQELERAGRVADFLELGELMCRDALAREESCGCHFRVEHQTEDGEARRDDERFAHVAAWVPRRRAAPARLAEPLQFETLRASASRPIDDARPR